MAKNSTTRDFDIQGNIFWILMILVALGTFVFYTILAYQSENLRLFIVASLFAIMVLAGLVLSRLEAFNGSTWRESTLAFTIGFIIWGFIGGGFFSQQSVLTIVQNNLFATISGELPLVVDFTFNTFLVPISEEIFWFFGLTYALISILSIIGKKNSFFDNAWVQMLIVLPLLALTFAFFHVGQGGATIFIISAIIFRLFVSAIVIGDQKFDWFKKINLGVAFALGVHISNNWFAYGFRRGFTVMSTEPLILVIVLLVFGAIFFTSLDTIVRFVSGNTNSLEDSR